MNNPNENEFKNLTKYFLESKGLYHLSVEIGHFMLKQEIIMVGQATQLMNFQIFLFPVNKIHKNFFIPLNDLLSYRIKY